MPFLMSLLYISCFFYTLILVIIYDVLYEIYLAIYTTRILCDVFLVRNKIFVSFYLFVVGIYCYVYKRSTIYCKLIDGKCTYLTTLQLIKTISKPHFFTRACPEYHFFHNFN